MQRVMRYSRVIAVAIACLVLGACASAPPAREVAAEYLNLGNEYLALGKWDKAGACYDKALALDPSLLSASYNLARAFIESGKIDRALETIAALERAEPDNALYIAMRAYALFKAGDTKGALAAYERVDSMNAFDPASRLNYATLLRADGRPEAAQKALEELAKARPDDERVARLLGLIAFDHGDHTTAAERLAAFIAKKPGDTTVLATLAASYEKLKRYKDAMDTWAALVAKKPTDAPAWFQLAFLRLTQAADGKGGLDALRKAVEAGFSDKAKAAELLNYKDLPSLDEIKKLLKEKKLID